MHLWYQNARDLNGSKAIAPRRPYPQVLGSDTLGTEQNGDSMLTGEELKALAQQSHVDQMMGNPLSDSALPSPTASLSPEEREIYHEVVGELAEECAARRS